MTLSRSVLAAVALLVALLVAPLASAQIYVGGGLSDDREVAPGTRYEGVVSIVNPSDEPQQVSVYLTDYRFASDGTNWYSAPGTTPRSNADWIAYGAPLMTVPPHSMLPVAYQVDVPEDAALEGTYWSILMVEGVPSSSAESTLGNEELRFGMEGRIRYGVQIATHIAQTGTTDLAIPAARVAEAVEGGRRLEIDVENTGSRLGETRVYLDVFDHTGQSVGRYEGTNARIYPGTSFRHRVPLGDVTPGTYEALLVIETDADTAYGAQYTLDLTP